jgi:pyruvate/2-oxoglutarate dehydrogenase complex dihydrolipoamide acyltransferase (E2) component
MDVEIRMPDMATTDSAIKILRWLVEPGAAVKRGQILMEIETDKSTMEVESVAAGVLKEHRAAAGDSVFAGQVIAVVRT